MSDHIHPLPVCGFGDHRPHAPGCASQASRMVACGKIVDPNHPHFGMALCRHQEPGALPDDLVAIPDPDNLEDADHTNETTENSNSETNTENETSNESNTNNSVNSENFPPNGAETLDDSGLPPPDPLPFPTPDEPFNWWQWMRWLLGLIAGGLVAWLFYLIWLFLKELGFWWWLADWAWRIFDWFSQLREWIEGPGTNPPDPPTEPPNEPPEDPPEDPETCTLLWASFPKSLKPVSLIKRPDGLIDAKINFDMHANFAATCSRCEYRQYVRGRFELMAKGTSTWVKKPHTTPKAWQPLSIKNWADDGYGHRQWKDDFFDRYLPRRSDGCIYRGHDEPGMTILAGDAIHVYLEFKGYIYDIDPTTGSKAPRFYNSWHIRILGRVVEKERRYLPWPNPIDFFYPKKNIIVLEPV